jgi:hypothetical protein
MYNHSIVTMADGTRIELEIQFGNTHKIEHVIGEWPTEVESVTFLDDDEKRSITKEDFPDKSLSNLSKVGNAIYSAINWTKDPLYPRNQERHMPRFVNSVRKEGHLSIHDLSQCPGNYKFVMERGTWHIRRVYLGTPLCDRSIVETEDTRNPVPESEICPVCLKEIREFSSACETHHEEEG